MRSLLEVMVEPLARSLALAPVEEEELTEETVAALDRARASLREAKAFRTTKFYVNWPEPMSEDPAPERIAGIGSPESRAELRGIDRATALDILQCLDRYLRERTGRCQKAQATAHRIPTALWRLPRVFPAGR